MDQSDVVSVPSTVSTSAIKKAKGSPVTENIRSGLGYDNSTLTQLKTLSGWFKNSEDTVQEYAAHCSVLFGTAWQKIIPQVAELLPKQTRKDELLSLFQSQSKTGKKKKEPPQLVDLDHRPQSSQQE